MRLRYSPLEARERMVAQSGARSPPGGELGPRANAATFSDFCSEDLEGPVCDPFDFPSSETGWLSCYTSALLDDLIRPRQQ